MELGINMMVSYDFGLLINNVWVWGTITRYTLWTCRRNQWIYCLSYIMMPVVNFELLIVLLLVLNYFLIRSCLLPLVVDRRWQKLRIFSHSSVIMGQEWLRCQIRMLCLKFHDEFCCLLYAILWNMNSLNVLSSCYAISFCRLDLLEMMLPGPCFLALSVAHVTLVWWLVWARKMHMLGMRLSPSVVS